MANFSERLVSLRKKKGLSQVALAERIGISGQVVSQYERGVTRPDLEILTRIADFFNVSSDYLLGKTNVTVRLVNEDELNVLDRMSEENGLRHYINDDTLAMAQELHDNRDLRIMFSSARNLSPEDLRFAVEMLKRMEQMSK